MSQIMDEKKPQKLDERDAPKNGRGFIYKKQLCPENWTELKCFLCLEYWTEKFERFRTIDRRNMIRILGVFF